MQTIEARVRVGSDSLSERLRQRTISVQLPTDVPTGKYEIVLVLNHRLSVAETAKPSAIQKIQALLKQSMEPGHSLADELIRERREAAERE